MIAKVKKTKKFFIIAGEASGDLLGSKLIKEIKKKEKNAKIIGVGGKLMKKEGLKSIFPMEDLSVMGFFEVIPHLKKLIARINQTAAEILKTKPDYVITIDSPDFSFRVVKKLQDFKGKKIHMIAPSVWAYREGRAKKIAKIYDLLLTILPFEPPYFEKYGLKTKFIGHPITENIPNDEEKLANNKKFRKKFKLKESDIIINVTPGSRTSEVKKIFPAFIDALNIISHKMKNIKVVIPLVDKTENLVKEMAKDIMPPVIFAKKDDKELAFCASNFALAKSGTNNLEFSLRRIPIIIAYKVSYLSYFLIKSMIKIKFINLINIISNKEIIPEMIQWDCRGRKIANMLKILIKDKQYAQNQIKSGQKALKLMGLNSKKSPSKNAVEEILAKSV